MRAGKVYPKGTGRNLCCVKRACSDNTNLESKLWSHNDNFENILRSVESLAPFSPMKGFNPSQCKNGVKCLFLFNKERYEIH